MIEPVIATALIISILALVAYYLQPQQPHHQSYYYHQIRRARVMADPQRRSRAGDVDRGAERRGSEWEVYEREHEEEGRETDEWAIGVRELGLIGRGVVRSELGLEDGADVEGKRLEAEMMGGCHGTGANGVNAAVDLISGDVSVQESNTLANTTPRGPSPPIIRITISDSDITSTILPLHHAMQKPTFENLGNNTLEQQRKQRVRFDEALRMQSYGGSQYVGRVVDKDAKGRL